MSNHAINIFIARAMICLLVGNSPAFGGFGIDADTIPPPDSSPGPSPLATAVIGGVHDDIVSIGINTVVSGGDAYAKGKGIEGVGMVGTAVDQVAVQVAIVSLANATTPAERNERSSAVLAAVFGGLASLVALALLPEVAVVVAAVAVSAGVSTTAATAVSVAAAAALSAAVQVAISAASHAAAHAVVNAGSPGAASPK